MGKLRALDLFCGEGGASWGIAQAGFDVTGIDVNPKCGDYYPFDFINADALDPPVDLADYAFIWASPPCQAFSSAVRLRGSYDNHVNLIPPTQALLAGHPYTAIENVPLAVRAGLRADIILTGPSLGLMEIERKRIFELSFPLLAPAIRKVKASTRPAGPLQMTKGMAPFMRKNQLVRRAMGLPQKYSRAEWEAAAGIEHEMSQEGAGESIPPAYSRYIAEGAKRLIERGSYG